MIRMLMWLLLLYIGYRIVTSLGAAKKAPLDQKKQPNSAVATHRDPVCGLYVSEDDAVIGRLEGERHYFCSKDCLDKFCEQLNHAAH